MKPVHGNDWSALVPPASARWTPTRRVSICIPARNPSNLRRVLDALALQTYPSALMEVVIADDGSDPPITATGDYPFPVSVVPLQRTLAFGAGRGRNAAARRAAGDLLVFLDADIVPERQVIASYARWFVDRSDVMAMGLCRFADMAQLTDEEFAQLVAEDGLGAHFIGKEVDNQEWRENTLRRTNDLRIEAVDAFRIVIGATFAITAAQYWAAGGFRELGIRGIEDTEFGYRVHASGAVMVFDRDAIHWHQGRRNMTLDRTQKIRHERQAYVERLLPVQGFRRKPPHPLDRPVHTVPQTVVHAVGDAARLNDLRGRVDTDHVVVGADDVAQAPDGMPFVASFCDIWLPAECCHLRTLDSTHHPRAPTPRRRHDPDPRAVWFSAGGDADSSASAGLQRDRLAAGRGPCAGARERSGSQLRGLAHGRQCRRDHLGCMAWRAGTRGDGPAIGSGFWDHLSAAE